MFSTNKDHSSIRDLYSSVRKNNPPVIEEAVKVKKPADCSSLMEKVVDAYNNDDYVTLKEGINELQKFFSGNVQINEAVEVQEVRNDTSVYLSGKGGKNLPADNANAFTGGSTLDYLK
jgi:alcohol dehydrogenase YqhD (iron-dependent ADH family)